VLDVRFYKTPELNVEVPVRSDGKISLDPIGDIQAAGLSPEALSKALSKKYAGELTDPRVTVIVRQFGGQVFVGGEVKNPAATPYANGLTALQAIAAVGGFLDTAQRNSVVLIRRDATGAYRGYKLELDKALTGEDMSQDVSLMSYDIIWASKSGIANVN